MTRQPDYAIFASLHANFAHFLKNVFGFAKKTRIAVIRWLNSKNNHLLISAHWLIDFGALSLISINFDLNKLDLLFSRGLRASSGWFLQMYVCVGLCRWWAQCEGSMGDDRYFQAYTPPECQSVDQRPPRAMAGSNSWEWGHLPPVFKALPSYEVTKFKTNLWLWPWITETGPLGNSSSLVV